MHFEKYTKYQLLVDYKMPEHVIAFCMRVNADRCGCLWRHHPLPKVFSFNFSELFFRVKLKGRIDKSVMPKNEFEDICGDLLNGYFTGSQVWLDFLSGAEQIVYSVLLLKRPHETILQDITPKGNVCTFSDALGI